MAELLQDATIESKVTELPGWEYSAGKLRKTWQLKGFLSTMMFANAVAHLAQESNHHPDLSIHDYNQLTITTTTHASGGVTDNDFRLAAGIEKLHAA